MAMNEIDLFMAAIRRLESGSFAGNYNARGPQVTSGMYAGERAMGAYQIMPGNWNAWANEAGLPGAQWQSRAAQDSVARFKFRQYYNQLGDWRLVAIAWFSGMNRARRVQAEGMESVASVRDVVGTSVPQYVDLISAYMHQAQDKGYGASLDPKLVGRLDPQARTSIERGTLSVDQPLFGNQYGANDPTMYPPSGQLSVVQPDLESANPDMEPLNAFAARKLEPRQNKFAALDNNQMHRNMSAILQGLSNSIRASAMQMGQGVAAPITNDEREAMDIKVDDKRGVKDTGARVT